MRIHLIFTEEEYDRFCSEKNKYKLFLDAYTGKIVSLDEKIAAYEKLLATADNNK